MKKFLVVVVCVCIALAVIPTGCAMGGSKTSDNSSTVTPMTPIEKANYNISLVNGNVSTLSWQFNSLSLRVTTLENKPAPTIPSIDSINQSISNLQNASVATNGNVSNISTQIGVLNGLNISGRLASLESPITRLLWTLNLSSINMSTFNLSFVNMSALPSLYATLSNLSGLSDWETNTSARITAIEGLSLSSRLAALEAEVATLNGYKVYIDTLPAQLGVITGSISALQSALDSTNGNVSALSGNLSTLEAEVSNLSTRVYNLEHPVTPPSVTPIITCSLSALQLLTNQSWIVTCTANDSQGYPLNYLWAKTDNASIYNFAGNSSVLWVFPTTGNYSIVCTVSDNVGGINTSILQESY